tara:strand:+ start:3396 stop:4760 length:1365 start_codon:yes stop_codon:yes gene_type:complete
MDNPLANIPLPELEALVAQRKAQSVLTFPDLDGKSMPKPSDTNFRELLLFYNISVRYNEMSREIEILVPGYKVEGDLYNNAVLGKVADICIHSNLRLTDQRLSQLLTMVAFENEYHPVRDWIDQQVWDGRSRLQDLYDSVVLKTPNAMKETMLRKWALSAVAALYHYRYVKKFSSEGVLTYSGDQGIGKTTWIEQLLPLHGRGVWNRGGVVLNMGDKDSQTKALSVWICELGELDATFKKSDIEALKGFITNETDSIRPPYAKVANKYSRSTVFYATVNEQQFLQDSENRRFWVMEVDRFINGNIDAGQLWAEVKQIYLSIRDKCNLAADRERNNEWGWFMSPAERKRMRPLQDQHKVINPIDDMLSNTVEPYDIIEAAQWEWRTVTSILQGAGISLPNKAQAQDAAKWMRKNGYQEDSRHRFKAQFVQRVSTGSLYDAAVLKQNVVNFNKGRD